MKKKTKSIQGQADRSSPAGAGKTRESHQPRTEESRHAGENMETMVVSMTELTPILKELLELRDATLIERIRQEVPSWCDTATVSHIEERLMHRLGDAIKEKLEEDVENGVVDFMRDMLVPGSSFERDLSPLVRGIVDKQLREKLGCLKDTIEMFQDRKADLRRGDKFTKPARVSVTMDPDIYNHMKALGGVLSYHIQAACALYLKVREKENEDSGFSP
jgi:hypothetical protein